MILLETTQDNQYDIHRDEFINLKKTPIPSINELVVIGGTYYNVARVVHSYEENVTWCFVERLIQGQQ